MMVLDGVFVGLDDGVDVGSLVGLIDGGDVGFIVGQSNKICVSKHSSFVNILFSFVF